MSGETPGSGSVDFESGIAAFMRPRLTRERRSGPRRVLVAFSGGPDSTALLAALARLAPELGCEPVAAHYDHALDSDSASRAAEARRVAERLGTRFTAERRTERLPPGRGLEAAARELRYAFLARAREDGGALGIAVAHHRDDQIETVLLRLLAGTGVYGLGGMLNETDGTVFRPLLGRTRREIEVYLASLGLRGIQDPTNRTLGAARNRVRHALLPALQRADPRIDEVALRLAAASHRAARRVDRALEAHFSGRRGDVHPTRLSVTRWEALPAPLRPFALASLHRRAGASYPPRATALRELERQFEEGRERLCVDCGDGWRWRRREDELLVERVPPVRIPKTPLFAYTLTVPGEVEIPEIGALIRVERQSTEAWMFRGSPTRTALVLPLQAGETVEIRNRRAGDRLQPLGCDYERPLKEILIDAKVARQQRQEIPLVLHAEQIAWVPGVTIDERFRIRDEETVWTASIQPLRAT